MVGTAQGRLCPPYPALSAVEFPAPLFHEACRGIPPISLITPQGVTKMKLVRYGAKGAEKPGLIDKSGQLRDLSAQVRDLDGEAYAPASLAKLDTSKLPAVDGKQRFGAPVTGISKFVAIGLNYSDHAKETGSPIPTEPIFFIKANTSLSGPNDAVEKPRGSTKLDWEVEIAAIIGTRAKYVSEADALNHVAGYCVCNDVSERNFQQERGGQW